MALQFVRKQTDEICREAVRQNGMALQFVKEQTVNICKEAVRNIGLAIITIFNQIYVNT